MTDELVPVEQVVAIFESVQGYKGDEHVVMARMVLDRLTSAPDLGAELVERVARVIYAKRPALTSDQFRCYPHTYGDARAYRRPEVEWAQSLAHDILAALRAAQGQQS